MKMRFGDILLKKKIITNEQLEKALTRQKKSGGKLAYNLVKMGFIKEEDALYYLSQQLGIPTVDLRNFDIEKDLIKLIPPESIKKYRCIPLNLMGDTLTVACTEPTNYRSMDELEFLTGYNIEPVLITDSMFQDAYKHYYKKTHPSSDVMDYIFDEKESSHKDILTEYLEEEEELVDILDFDNIVKGALDDIEVIEEEIQDDTSLTELDAPIVKLVNGILVKAINSKSSDVHIEPYEKLVQVRLRVDGTLKRIMSVPSKIKNAVVSRIKIMAKLDIAEKRLPQDGRIKLKLGKKRDMDFRVSVLPTLFGEKVVLRLLDKANLQLDMAKLGFNPEDLDKFKKAIRSQYGMILVTGPTGSGKTTTLYSALNRLNDEGTNIVTAEDPVEFNLPGINQVQVHEQIGLTFAAALRSFLRQDPDIIMVGEIRDFETVEIAVRAALTGHLVFSTLHTNDAPSTIIRLVDMGIESYLVSSAVIMVIAQRLARRICPSCKGPAEAPDALLKTIGFTAEEIKNGVKIYKGHGCTKCNGTGYKGRVALYEVMELTSPIKEAIIRGASTDELRTIAIKGGMKTLRDSGLQKIREGMTTMESVLGVTF